MGANPGAKDFLAYRMAACAGDMEAMISIEFMDSPSAYALGDALAWATRNERLAVVEHLHSRMEISRSSIDSLVVSGSEGGK